MACGRRGPLRGSAGPGGELGRARVGEGGSVRAGPSAKGVGRGRGEAGPACWAGHGPRWAGLGEKFGLGLGLWVAIFLVFFSISNTT